MWSPSFRWNVTHRCGAPAVLPASSRMSVGEAGGGEVQPDARNASPMIAGLMSKSLFETEPRHTGTAMNATFRDPPAPFVRDLKTTCRDWNAHAIDTAFWTRFHKSRICLLVTSLWNRLQRRKWGEWASDQYQSQAVFLEHLRSCARCLALHRAASSSPAHDVDDPRSCDHVCGAGPWVGCHRRQCRHRRDQPGDRWSGRFLLPDRYSAWHLWHWG